MPILTHHDSRQVETVCYAEVPAPDAITARFRSLAHGWRSTCGLSHTQLAELIRADAIDVLVDLAGHTAHNRLPVFAWKPAPVQVTYLGYPNTTGLAAIDYRLTDAITDPPGEPASHAEELWRLPGCFCCYTPFYQFPTPTPSPAHGAGSITFGSMHKLTKLNGPVLDLWCRLLQAVPSSRLLVCQNTLVGGARDRLRRELVRRGIAAGRVELRHEFAPGPGGHLAVYAEIDVLLDVFPWGAHATACEALWMGVPVLTLYGDRYAGRMASSMLTCLQLEELIARTPTEFVERGVRLAGDTARLAALRGALRGRMRASPLCDGATFTLRLEEAYRAMWVRWCAQSSMRSN